MVKRILKHTSSAKDGAIVSQSHLLYLHRRSNAQGQKRRVKSLKTAVNGTHQAWLNRHPMDLRKLCPDFGNAAAWLSK